MKKTSIAGLAIIIFFLSVVTLNAQERLYPEGYNIDIGYTISDTSFSTSDTIRIDRTITNSTGSPLRNLYLDELLPEEFRLIGFDIGVNGNGIAYYYNRHRSYTIYPGYYLYEWLIDYPDDSDTANVALNPSQTLELSALYICTYPGSYVLPFHSACFVSDEAEFFSVAPENTIEANIYVSIEGDQSKLPKRTDFGIAYPNPFNNAVVFKFSTDDLNYYISGILRIFDIRGRLVHYTKFVESKSLRWHPSENLAGGIYFYSIIAEDMITTGKIVYLK